ncbi:MAG: biotin/lipoyl-containing protein [Fervidicoccaceae archaeon]
MLERELVVRVGGREYRALVREIEPNKYVVRIEGREISVEITPTSPRPRATSTPSSAAPTALAPPAEAPSPLPRGAEALGPTIEAPVPGKILTIRAGPGDLLERGAVVLTMESMKMELEIRAPAKCRVKEVLVKPGDFVEVGSPLVRIEEVV